MWDCYPEGMANENMGSEVNYPEFSICVSQKILHKQLNLGVW